MTMNMVGNVLFSKHAGIICLVMAWKGIMLKTSQRKIILMVKQQYIKVQKGLKHKRRYRSF